MAAAVGRRAYLRARWALGLIVAGATELVALGVPLAAGRFDRSSSIAELAPALLATVAMTAAGTALSAWFAAPLVSRRWVAVLGLMVCEVLTVPLGVPAIATATALNVTEDGSSAGRRDRVPLAAC